MNRLEVQIHPLLTEKIVAALNQIQIYDVLGFIKTNAQQIVKASRLNFREVLAIRNFLLKKFSAPPINGFDCYKATLNNTTIIPTGISSMDHLLGGGFFTGNIYEICGLPATGKTHFVLSFIKNAVQTTNYQTMIFDTKSDFPATKMKNMLISDQAQAEKYLRRIVVNRTYSKYDLINGLHGIKNNLENKLKLRLIIIDSLPSVVLNSNDYISNNIYLNHIANIIRYIATHYNVAFLIINLVRTWQDNDTTMQKESTETIACGKYWLSVPNTRIKSEKLEGVNLYRMTILSSDNLVSTGNKSVDIRLNAEGFL